MKNSIPNPGISKNHTDTIAEIREACDEGGTPASPAHVALWHRVSDDVMVSIMPTSVDAPKTTSDGLRYADVLIESWKVRRKITEKIRYRIGDFLRWNKAPVLQGTEGKMDHSVTNSTGKLVWSDKPLSIENLESRWIKGGVALIRERIALLVQEDEPLALLDDPLWKERYGFDHQDTDWLRQPLLFELDDSTAHLFDGGEKAYEKFLRKDVNVELLWDELCAIAGRKPIQYQPIIFGAAAEGQNYISGGVHRPPMGHHVERDLDSQLRITGAVEDHKNFVELWMAKEASLEERKMVVTHELAHLLTPFCPHNQLIIEGIAELFTALVNNAFDKKYCIGRLTGITDLLGTDNIGYDLGDGVMAPMTQRGLYSLRGNVGAQLLWDVLERKKENFQTLVRLLQSPSTDRKSTASFLREVDRYLPGFARRFADHPSAQPIRNGMHLAAIAIPKGFMVNGFQYESNPKAATTMETVPKTDFDYIWEDAQLKLFNTEQGQEKPLAFKMVVQMGPRQFLFSSPATGLIGIEYNSARLLEEKGFPKNDLYGKPLTAEFEIHNDDGTVSMSPKTITFQFNKHERRAEILA